MAAITNENRARIYELLEIDAEGDWLGGLQRFSHIPYQSIREIADLLGESFLKEAQNYAPSTEEFLSILEHYQEETTFHGYVIHPDRDDERVTIEGCYTMPAIELIESFRHADEFSLNEDSLYVWWD